MAIDDGESRWTTSWGMLLKLPEEGYLEGPEGPWPLRHVRWVELSTARVKGGLAGRPREMIDFTEELLSELSAMQVVWELRDTTWSIERIFDEEPIRVAHFPNPFGPRRARRV